MAVKRKRSTIVASLDGWFSKYIRLKYSKDGFGHCFTCGKKAEWKELQAGHFQSRAKYSTRWDEDNVRPQCAGCNISNGGQQYVFGLRLNQEREGLADEMVRLSHEIRKFSNGELEEMESYYREQVKRLLE
jgi:hypothetical protein